METKEELVGNVKEWIKVDNEIMKLKMEIKERNNKKKLLSESLMTVMKKNEIDCFDITGGAIMYKKSKVKKPLNGKTLMTALHKFYKNDSEMVETLTKHILDSREEAVKEVIRRKIDK